MKTLRKYLLPLALVALVSTNLDAAKRPHEEDLALSYTAAMLELFRANAMSYQMNNNPPTIFRINFKTFIIFMGGAKQFNLRPPML